MGVNLQPRRAATALLLGGALALAGACGSMRSCAAPPARPHGQFLYAVHDTPGALAPSVDPRIAAFQVDAGTGALRPVEGGAASAGTVGAFALAVDPSGRWFSLAGSQLGLYQIKASGAVEPAAKPAAGLSGYFDPQGRYFYLVGGDGLKVFPVDSRRGVQLSTPLHTEAGMLGFVMGAPPDGSLLYAASEKLHVYTVGDRGTLRAAPGSPHDLSVRALELAVHPSGRFVVVLGEGRGRRLIAVLRTGSDGSVTEVAGSPFDLGADVRAMAMAPDGASLFLTDADRHSIQTFALDAGGGLHELASTPLDVPQAGHLAVDAQGRYLYASDMKSGAVHGFAIDASGALTVVPGSPFAVGPRVGSLVASPRLEGPLQAAALPEPDALASQAPPARADPSTFRSASVDALAAALKDPSDDARYFAIAALAGRTDVDAVMPAIVAALDDPHPPVRKMAGLIVGPWALTHPGQVDDAVLDRLVSGPTGRGAMLDNASLTALHALKQRGAAAAPYLAKGLVNSGQLREEAEDALRDLGPAAAPAVPELRRLLQVNSEVRAHAANALGWIGPPAAEAIPDLYAMLEDPSPGAKRAAKFAIERIRGR